MNRQIDRSLGRCKDMDGCKKIQMDLDRFIDRDR